MAFSPTPGTVLVQLRMGVFSQLVINSFYFKKPQDWTETQIDTLVSTVDLAVTNHLAPMMTDEVNYSQMYIRDLSAQFSFIRVAAFTAIHGDIIGTPLLPLNVTLAVKFATGLAGRGRQGRVYWPAMPASWVTNNFVNGTNPTDIADAYSDFITAITTSVGNECDHVVVHSVENGVPLNPRTTSQVTDVLVGDTVVDSQRRRLPGRGA